MIKVLLFLSAVNAWAADPILLKNGREIFASYASITGISDQDSELRELYRLNSDRFPKQSAPEELSNSVILASTELGGAFCRKAVMQEKGVSRGQRILFGIIDFKRGPSQLKGVTQELLIEHLAESFWQRNAKPAELQSIAATLNKLSQGNAEDPAETLKVLQTVCTVYATSLAFLSK